MNWARKYRPYRIKDLHLETVRVSLESFLKQGKIPQALLFAGPKGTGKTSASRIIGALLNSNENATLVKKAYFSAKAEKLSPLFDISTLDDLGHAILDGQSYVVQEMDAASNRGIDDIRALKSRIMLPPQEGLLSVFILDEAHMLTTEAFNALLKVLEEPPSHVIFILATTELHKIPATIVSRCQLVAFQKASTKELEQALENVLKNEKTTFDEEALAFIAESADGSFRDAIKMAEAASSGGKLTKADVDALSTYSRESELEKLVLAVINKDSAKVISIFKDLRENGVNPNNFYQQLMSFLHKNLEISYGLRTGGAVVDKAVTKFLLGELLKESLLLPSPIPHLPLQLKLLEIIDRAKKNSGTDEGGSENQEPRLKKIKPSKVVAELKQDQHLSSNYAPNPDLDAVVNNWQQLVKEVSKTNHTFAALLQSARPRCVAQDRLSIGVFYQFHQEQMASPKFLSILEPILEKTCNTKIEIEIDLIELSREDQGGDDVDAQANDTGANDADQSTQLLDMVADSLM